MAEPAQNRNPLDAGNRSITSRSYLQAPDGYAFRNAEQSVLGKRFLFKVGVLCWQMLTFQNVP